MEIVIFLVNVETYSSGRMLPRHPHHRAALLDHGRHYCSSSSSPPGSRRSAHCWRLRRQLRQEARLATASTIPACEGVAPGCFLGQFKTRNPELCRIGLAQNPMLINWYSGSRFGSTKSNPLASRGRSQWLAISLAIVRRG